MIPEINFSTETAVLKFYSLADLRRYLKRLLESYEREMDKLANVMGNMMRDEKIDAENPSTKGWAKAGNVFVNKQEPEKGTLDVLFHLTHEIRPKIKHVEETLTSADQFDSLEISENSTFLLYVRDGVPERIIAVAADEPGEEQEKFVLTATYKTV